MKKYALYLFSILALSTMPLSLALASYPSDIKSYEDKFSPILSGQVIDPKEICDQMFINDEKNLFKDVICSLTRVVAASTSQFSTETTCKIQQIPTSGNYVAQVEFNYKNGVCDATLDKAPQGTNSNHIFGSSSGSNSLAQTAPTGLYKGPSKLTADLQNKDQGTQKAFNALAWILSIGALLALLVYAFSSILNIEINTYSFKKALPRAAGALVGGWIALATITLLSRFVDFFYRFDIFSPYQSLHPMANIFSGNFSQSSASGASDLEKNISLIFQSGGQFLESSNSLASLILGVFVLGIPAIVVIAFEYVMALRPFAVSLLAAVSPIAFASFILPQTQVFFKKWLQYLLIAIFYPLAVNFVFYFLNLIEVSGNNPVPFLAQWGFKIFAIIVLIRLPFTLTSDLNAITSKLSSSALGQSLGLSKVFPQQTKPKEQTASATSPNNRISQVIAPRRNLISKISGNFKNPNTYKQTQIRSDQNVEEFSSRAKKLMLVASNTNLQRSPEMIKNSISNLSSDALKLITQKSDLQIWRDTRLIEQLKNQDGQILDEQGAALRADSVRKAIRLSQLSENKELVNKDLIKYFASKGALSILPEETVRKALEQQIISTNDIASSFGKNYRFENTKDTPESIEKGQLKRIFEQDRLDYSSGFNSLKDQIDQEARALLPRGKSAAGEIATNFMSSENISRENLPYVTKRLKEEENGSIAKLSSIISGAGVEKKTALALAQNKQIRPEQIAKYLPSQNNNQQTLALISEQVAKRDLNSAVSSKISENVSAQETASTAAIIQKISGALKSNSQLNLDEISKLSTSLLEKAQSESDSKQIDPLAQQIDKLHPAVQITTSNDTGNSIGAAVKKAKEVKDTIDVIKQAGFDENDLKNNPTGIINKISKLIHKKNNEDVSADSLSSINSDSAFDSELGKISPAQTKKPSL